MTTLRKRSIAPDTAAQAFCQRMCDETVRFVMGFRHQVARREGLWHQHESFEVVYHPSGWGETAYGHPAQTLTFAEGSIVIYPPGLPHNQTNHAAGEDWCILGAVAGEVPALLRQPLYLSAATDASALDALRILTAIPPVISPWQQGICSHRLTTLLLQCIESTLSGQVCRETAGDQYVEAARAYVAAHYAEIRHIEQIAESIGISYDYLRHLFRQQSGMSLTHYLTWLRIERARHLLRHSILPLKVIAQQIGFDNDRYFSKVFRETVGCTPGSYRRQPG